MISTPAWAFENPAPDPFGKGQAMVDFINRLPHPKAWDGKFSLDFWEPVTRWIYGPCHPNGQRIAKTVIANIPRGNRKSTWESALILGHLIGPERVPGGQVVSAGPDRKVSRIPFQEIVDILSMMNTKGVLDIQDYRSKIVCPKLRTTYEALSADSGSQHGRTISLAAIEELHAWPKRDLFDVVRTSLSKTPNTLMLVVTTAGRGHENVAWEMVDYGRRVARGEIDDPTTLYFGWEATEDEDINDSAVAYAVNPGMAYGFPDAEAIARLVRECEHLPAQRANVKQLHFNIWQDASADPFVSMVLYDRGADPVDVEALKGEPCWVAVDLGLTQDLAAVVTAWRDGEDGYQVACRCFCSEEGLRARADRDRAPYPLWRDQGHLIVTPGAVTDYSAIGAYLRELCRDYDVKELAFDPAFAQGVAGPLLGDGLPVVHFRQGWATMAPAIKELERAIVGGKLRHGGHPILRHHFDCVAVEVDKAGNKSFHKGRSRDRIDAAVACAMAVARAAASEGPVSIYDRPELWGESETGQSGQSEKPPIGGVSADGFDWSILKDPRHPRFSEERDRYNAMLAARDDEFEDAW